MVFYLFESVKYAIPGIIVRICLEDYRNNSNIPWIPIQSILMIDQGVKTESFSAGLPI